MATKSDFTEEQWNSLAFAIEDAVMLVSVANGAHFFESISEVTASARFMADQAKASNSTLVRDLATGLGMHRDKTLPRDLQAMEPAVLQRVTDASKIVADVALDELPAFKEFLLGSADAAAEAKNGVDSAEASAIEKITAALG
jgi:hypothetical protein